jgi:DNA-binding NtrC family response regulator
MEWRVMRESPKRSPVTLHDRVETDLFPELVIVSEHMRSVIKIVQQIAVTDTNVLISGESGTGKEILARLIHQKSVRRDQPFVPINCGLLSGDLFESKLFGHEAGAFTGATRRTKGRFEQAHGGTLFLDEVSEISLQNQASFLRVLEDGCFYPIGSELPMKVNVRIVAATNKDLAARVKQDYFRKDLYYRLQVIPINLLPLRERKEAIPHLVDCFLNRLANLYPRKPVSVTPEAMRFLVSSDWPGNIREMKNLLERMFLMIPNDTLDVDDFPEDFLESLLNQDRSLLLNSREARSIEKQTNLSSGIPMPSLKEARQKLEKDLILEALTITGGQRGKAAELLQIKPRTLRQKMSQYRLQFARTRKITGQGD